MSATNYFGQPYFGQYYAVSISLKVSDSSAVTENINIQITASVSTSDASAVTDSTTQVIPASDTLTIIANEFTFIVDTVTITIPVLNTNVNETSAVTDFTRVTLAHNINVSDASSVADAPPTLVRPAPVLSFSSLTPIGIETGIINRYTPTAPAMSRINATETWDMVAGDNALPWDDGTGGVLYSFGDSYGTEWTGPLGGVVASGHTTTISGNNGAVGALTGTQSVTVAANGTTGFATSGIVSVNTGGNPGNWSAFTYTSTNSNHFLNCKWLTGSGTMTNAMQVKDGDPRSGGAHRDGMIARSTNADLSGGYIIDDFRPLVAGVGQKAPNFTQGTNVIGNAFPADAPTFNIATINIAAWAMTITTSVPHNLSRLTPGVLISGVTSSSTTVAPGSNSQNVASLPSHQLFVNNLVSSGLTPSGTVAVTTSAGTSNEAIISYISTGTNVLNGCVLISGSGTLTTGNAVVQGVDNANGEFRLGSVIDAYTLTITMFFSPNRAGRPNTGSFKEPKFNQVADPTTSNQAVLAGSGGISIANGGGAGVTRQYLFNAGIVWAGAAQYCNALFLYYSDDVGQTWTRSSVNWPNNSTFTSLITSAMPVLAPDGYIYLMITGTIDSPTMARVLPADIQTKANYQYWNGSSWITGDPTALVPIISNANLNVPSWHYNAFYQCFIATTIDVSTFNLVMRTAWSPEGPWSAPQDVVQVSYFTFPQPFVFIPFYGGFVHPWSGRAPNNPADIYFTLTLADAYSNAEFRITLDLNISVHETTAVSDSPTLVESARLISVSDTTDVSEHQVVVIPTTNSQAIGTDVIDSTDSLGILIPELFIDTTDTTAITELITVEEIIYLSIVVSDNVATDEALSLLQYLALMGFLEFFE